MRSKYFTNLFFGLLLLLTTSVQAAVFPTGPSLQIGGRTFTDLTNLITIGGRIAGSGAAWTTLRKPNATAGYQVTAGKTLTLYACAINSNASASLTNSFVLGYGSTDAGFDGSVPTSPVYWGASAASFIASAPAIGSINYVYPNFTIAQNLYPFVSITATADMFVTCYGYEN